MNRFDCYPGAPELAPAASPAPPQARRDKKTTLGAQASNALESIPANVAEGRARAGADRIYHFRVALGSARELQAELDTAVARRFLTGEDVAEALALLDRVCAMLWKLIQGGR